MERTPLENIQMIANAKAKVSDHTLSVFDARVPEIDKREAQTAADRSNRMK